MQYFFTDFNSITGQVAADAYGPKPVSDSNDNFLLETKFSVAADAPAIAVCKSLLLAQEDISDNTLINVALFPLQSAFGDLPVKFIIYRGIKKSSLYNSSGVISTNYTGWKPEANILFRIHQIQSDINVKNQQNIAATKKYLGSHITSDMYLEQAFVLAENPSLVPSADLFYPLVVEQGFMIGKFNGGTKKAGLQVVLDKIGHEYMLSDLRKTTDLFQVPSLPVNPSPELKFKNRFRKQKVLAYIDYCALLGNQVYIGDSQIKNYNSVSLSDDNLSITALLEVFQNKTTVYFDIRDDYGNSHNMYFDTSDVLKISVKPVGSDDYVIISTDYYNSNWPLCQLQDYQTSDGDISDAKIGLSVPIYPGDPVFDYYAYIYSGHIGETLFSISKSDEKPSLSDTGIQVNYTHDMPVFSPVNNSGKFHSFHHLIKLSAGVFPQDSNPFNQFFPLTMDCLIGDDNLEDGDFKVYTYSSINAPLIRKKNEVYTATMGIAKDKYNVTFFAYKADSVKSTSKMRYLNRLAATGTFKYQMFLDEYVYQPGQAMGFLTALPYRFLNGDDRPDYDLKEFEIETASEVLTAFLAYVKVGKENQTDDFFESFDALCISNSEYRSLLNKVIASAASDYESNFSYYFSQYLALTRFKASVLTETFAYSDFTAFRYAPAFIKLNNSLDSAVTGSTTYSIRQDNLSVVITGRKTAEAEAAVEDIFIPTSVILNSLLLR